MHKARLPQQAGLDDTVRTFASSPRNERCRSGLFRLLVEGRNADFLKDLLESERIGTRRMQQSDARLTFMLQTWSRVRTGPGGDMRSSQEGDCQRGGPSGSPKEHSRYA